MEFSRAHHIHGWTDFGTLDRFTQYGGYDMKDDTCSFQLIFAVKEMEKVVTTPAAHVLNETHTRRQSSSENENVDADHAMAISLAESESGVSQQEMEWSLSNS